MPLMSTEIILFPKSCRYGRSRSLNVFDLIAKAYNRRDMSFLPSALVFDKRYLNQSSTWIPLDQKFKGRQTRMVNGSSGAEGDPWSSRRFLER